MKTLVVILVLVGAALMVPLPEVGRLAGCLGDFLHVACFALLGALVYRVLKDRTRLPRTLVMLLSWIMVSSLGLATEIAQSFVAGRTASWMDLWADTCGGLAGIIWVGISGLDAKGHRIRLFALGCTIFLFGGVFPTLRLTDVVIQQLQFPQLASFESPLELFRLQAGDSVVTRVQQHATGGRWALQVELSPGEYPGVVLSEPLPDWSGFRELVMDVYLPNGPPLNVTVKIADSEHNGDYYDRFNRVVQLLPGGNVIRVELSEIAAAPRGRSLDLKQIVGLSLFTISPNQPRTFFLDNIRLR